MQIKVLLLFSSLIILSLNVMNAENSIIKNENVTGRIVEHFYSEYSYDLPVILEIKAGDYTKKIESLFKQRLVNDGYELFIKAPQKYQRISISYEHKQTISLKEKIFSRIETRFVEERFVYELTLEPEGKVLLYDILTFSSPPEIIKSGMRWYDPIAISLIIGGMVYSLYFGL